MGTIIRRASRLFAKPSFLEGMSRVLDIGATLNIYNTDRTPEEADSEAIKSDWATVADELYAAMVAFEEQQKIGNRDKVVRSTH